MSAKKWVIWAASCATPAAAEGTARRWDRREPDEPARQQRVTPRTCRRRYRAPRSRLAHVLTDDSGTIGPMLAGTLGLSPTVRTPQHKP